MHRPKVGNSLYQDRVQYFPRKTLCPVPGNFLPVICVCVQCTCSIQQYLMITGREDYISIHLVDLYNSTLNVYTKSNSTENKKSFIPWILRM